MDKSYSNEDRRDSMTGRVVEEGRYVDPINKEVESRNNKVKLCSTLVVL